MTRGESAARTDVSAVMKGEATGAKIGKTGVMIATDATGAATATATIITTTEAPSSFDRPRSTLVIITASRRGVRTASVMIAMTIAMRATTRKQQRTTVRGSETKSSIAAISARDFRTVTETVTEAATKATGSIAMERADQLMNQP